MKPLALTSRIALLATLAAPLGAHAAILLNDTFTDGGRTNGVDALDTAWFVSQTASNTGTVSVSTAGNSLAVTADRVSNNTGAVIDGGFASTTLLVGQTIQLSVAFNAVFGTGQTAFRDAAGLLRIGLYNGTVFSADNTTGPIANDSFTGYDLFPNVGGLGGSNTIRERTGSLGTAPYMVNSGAMINLITPFDGPDALTGTNTIRLDITRTGTDTASLAYFLNGTQIGGTATDSSSITSTFNGVRLMMSSQLYNAGDVEPATINFDNIKVEVIPEPGAALLGGLGVLALLRRRR